MTHVQVVVSDDQKARWSEYAAEEPAVDSISDLVRTAVEEYIARDKDSEPSELNPPVVDGDLDEIEGRLANIEDQLDLLRLENVEEEQLEEVIEFVVEEHSMYTADYILEELGHDDYDGDPRRYK
ncbi:hypothetical protein [Halomicrococcus sp. SG-WS-1]|uniref:hypothetical protein n=1 Tax=Halomicrococcus sp. SG-WS-1 TaxID=3439057 RepID=UPI003F7A6709